MPTQFPLWLPISLLLLLSVLTVDATLVPSHTYSFYGVFLPPDSHSTQGEVFACALQKI